MKQSDDQKIIPMTSFASGTGHELVGDVYYYTNQIVNVIFIGEPGKKWVMVDAGMPSSANQVISAAEERFGKDNPPQAIILTHGHFDHIGSIVDLIEKWKAPVYAHPHEFPFLCGQEDYPEPDVTVEGGLLAKISSYYPHRSINISEVLHPVQPDYSLPFLPGWTWVHTPGHTPGHISLYRSADHVLIAGDAFVTVRTDSFYKVLVNKEEINGPPRYLTTDWKQAENSVKKLAALNPHYAITGHGPAMSGKALSEGLKNLSEHFQSVAVPDYGRFVAGDE